MVGGRFVGGRFFLVGWSVVGSTMVGGRLVGGRLLVGGFDKRRQRCTQRKISTDSAQIFKAKMASTQLSEVKQTGIEKIIPRFHKISIFSMLT